MKQKKNNKLDFIKIKNFYSTKYSVKTWKKKMAWELYLFPKDIADKRLLSKIKRTIKTQL